VTVSEAAYQWQAQGVCTIPILPNKTKRPVVRWKEYQLRLPLDGEMSDWWGNGHEYGLALIMGKVSGNVEMTELESTACDSASITEIINRCDELGVGHVWDLLQGPSGYSEMSPSGGLHFIYRVTDEIVPGNEKIAAGQDGKVLSETRGEGGYVIVAPTSGLCHPTGESWVLVNGEAGQVPTISWAERCLLHEAIRLALHYTEPVTPTGSGVALRPAPLDAPAASPSLPAVMREGAELRPGDDFEQRVSWASILAPEGWQRGITESDGTTYWTRPGKDPRDGYSATTGHAGDRDRLWVFSTSTSFPSEESITKFRAYSILRFNGDDSACASQLSTYGFGKRSETPVPALGDDADFHFSEIIDTAESFDFTDQGNAEQMRARTSGQFVWTEEEKSWHGFDGKRWIKDHHGLYQEVVKLAKQMTRSSDSTTARWGKKSQSDASVEATKRALRHQPGMSASASQFNQRRDLLNLGNGTLDLFSGELLPHNPEHFITQLFNASYDPRALCPKFDSFIAELLPDPEIRAYVQRALGATLLGEAGSRAVFLAHGPSGTGKSQFLELVQFLMGSYGTTAPASTFRTKRDSAPSHDLHKLRGKRFVATSETSDTAQFDEELLKRLTGGDTISSRDLYETFQEWVPECDIWMATNFPPRFSSDDNAMWNRAKLIPFMTVLGQTEGSSQPIPNYARNHLFAEADGILNWLLAGLRDFLANGLGEPEQVGQAAQQLRLESDPVAQFAEELVNDGVLEKGSTCRIRSSELNNMYQAWSRDNGLRAVSQRRFGHRLASSYPELERVKSGGQMWVVGIQRSVTSSILGGFQT
jgi:putative DNA primase/helicase